MEDSYQYHRLREITKWVLLHASCGTSNLVQLTCIGGQGFISSWHSSPAQWSTWYSGHWVQRPLDSKHSPDGQSIPNAVILHSKISTRPSYLLKGYSSGPSSSSSSSCSSSLLGGSGSWQKLTHFFSSSQSSSYPSAHSKFDQSITLTTLICSTIYCSLRIAI